MEEEKEGASLQYRKLHSNMTFFVKFVFPILWIGVFGGASLLLFLEDGLTGFALQFLLALVVGSIFSFATHFRKRKFIFCN